MQMRLPEALERIAAERAHHVLGSPASPADLDDFERRRDISLPPPFRAFLLRFGGGLFYQRHEIAGTRTVVVHDIEVVPDLPGLRRELALQEEPEGLLPFHRVGGLAHGLALSSPDGAVHELGSTHVYSSFADFLHRVVLPPVATVDGEPT